MGSEHIVALGGAIFISSLIVGVALAPIPFLEENERVNRRWQRPLAVLFCAGSTAAASAGGRRRGADAVNWVL
jgi:hypothetical protein